MEALEKNCTLDFVLSTAAVLFTKSYLEVSNHPTSVQYLTKEDDADKIVVEIRGENSTMNCIYNELMHCECICIFPDDHSDLEHTWLHACQDLKLCNSQIKISYAILYGIGFIKITR